MKLHCELVVFLTSLFIHDSCETVLSISVDDYGAYPNDNLDDTHAIQSAINHARLNSVVTFGFGTYNLSSAVNIVNAQNLIITGQGIDKTFLIGNVPTSIFSIQSGQNLTISHLSIDFDPLPFTAGYVLNVTHTYLDLQVVSPHQTDVNRSVGAILRYDPIAMRPAFGSKTYEIYQTLPQNSTTTLVSPGILRIPLNYATQFLPGDAIVARYGSQNHVIGGSDAEDLTIDSINIYTSWCMGCAITRAKRLTIRNYHVLRRDQRWLSTIADCLNFLHSEEYVHIYDSKCSSMGDDGLNIGDMIFSVQEILNSTSVIIQTFAWTDTLNVGIGIELEFSHNQTPFTPYTKGKILSIQDHDSKSRIFTFESSLNVNVNDYVVVSNVPSVIIQNLTIENNRARGIILQTRNATVTNSILNQTSGPAVLLQPSLYWYAGPGAINISLTKNLFINNNEGIASEKGVISISPYPTQLIPVVKNIQISSSTFRPGLYSQALVQSFNGENIFFSQNYIETNNSSPLINICNTQTFTASNNTLVNTQTNITDYYIFDTIKPCSRNFSSLIDIPPSAFNSSFPPPV